MYRPTLKTAQDVPYEEILEAKIRQDHSQGFFTASNGARGSRQRRFHDFNVWSAKKRKLVANPKGWPWSSNSTYEGRGTQLLSIDFQP
jgi:hypothetical protein